MLLVPQQRYLHTLLVTSSPLWNVQSNQELWHGGSINLYHSATLQYSDGNPLNAICGRGDLSANKPRAYGCYDTKVASFRMAQQLLAEGIVGPAGAEAGQTPFSWSGAAPSLRKASHVGEADRFAFSFEPLQPSQMRDSEQPSSVARGMPASFR